MIRTQVYLPKDLHAKLNKLARSRKEPMAQLVREYVEKGITKDLEIKHTNVGKILELITKAKNDGLGKNLPTDIASNHDKYIAEAIAYENNH